MPKRFIFRMVYYEDCSLFFKDGELRAKNSLQNQKCHQTSHAEIVSRRGEQGILTPSGRVINDHVAFYFSPITGMAYAIHRGSVPLVDPNGTVLRQATMDDRVFFVANTNRFRDAGLTFWFSDIACNARAPLPKFDNNLDNLKTHIAWDLYDETPIIGAVPEIGYAGVTKYFRNFDTPERYQSRSQKRMAEFLVQDAIPLSMFDCIITKSDWIREEIRRMMKGTGFDLPVHSKPGCYF